MTPTGSSRDYWYPAALAEEVTDAPFATELLGERIVLARLDGEVAAFSDLCIHRGTPLSMGRVEAGQLVCAYHGWRYGRSGDCVAIPQLREGQHVPAKARVTGYATAERYGAIWVCLGEPRLPITDYPETADPAYRTIFSGAYVWEAGAARVMENFLDTAHFAWVHPGLLGDPERPLLDLSPIESLDDGFQFCVESDVPNPDGKGWTREPVMMRWIAPYNLMLTRERVTEGGSSRYVLFTAVQPMQRHRTRRYTWLARNYAFDRPDASFIDFLDKLREQDRAVVEAQRPEELPLDLTAEMHIRGIDAAAIEFRRQLERLGLEDSSVRTTA